MSEFGANAILHLSLLNLPQPTDGFGAICFARSGPQYT
jgi:hypothetical protein